jgi:hypothetical protein
MPGLFIFHTAAHSPVPIAPWSVSSVFVWMTTSHACPSLPPLAVQIHLPPPASHLGALCCFSGIRYLSFGLTCAFDRALTSYPRFRAPHFCSSNLECRRHMRTSARGVTRSCTDGHECKVSFFRCASSGIIVRGRSFGAGAQRRRTFVLTRAVDRTAHPIDFDNSGCRGRQHRPVSRRWRPLLPPHAASPAPTHTTPRSEPHRRQRARPQKTR